MSSSCYPQLPSVWSVPRTTLVPERRKEGRRVRLWSKIVSCIHFYSTDKKRSPWLVKTETLPWRRGRKEREEGREGGREVGR